MCDIVDMNAAHILLGTDVVHHGRSNQYVTQIQLICFICFLSFFLESCCTMDILKWNVKCRVLWIKGNEIIS